MQHDVGGNHGPEEHSPQTGVGFFGIHRSKRDRDGAGPRRCETPASQRASDIGCYLDASEILGVLPQGPQYWHLYTLPTRKAAEMSRGPHGTVVEAFGRFSLYTIAEQAWHPSNGERVAVIGPLPVKPGRQYVAR